MESNEMKILQEYHNFIFNNHEIDKNLNDILEIIPLLISIAKVNDNTYIYVNQFWLNTLEFRYQDVIGKTASELNIFSNRELLQEFANKVLKEGTVKNYEMKFQSKTGKTINGLLSGRLTFFQGEKVILYLAVDITEKKQTEEKLVQLATIVESSEDAIIGMNLEYNITSWNAGAEKIYGYSEAEILGRPVTTLLPPENQKFRGIAQKILANGNIESFEGSAFRKDGNEIFISAKISLMRNRQGIVIGLSAIHRDITEKKAMEEEIQKNHKLESLGVLAGGIAHDFNNYMAAIMSNIQLAGLRLKKGDDIQSLLQSTQDILLQATGLTQQLLAFSRGGAPIKKVASLKDIISDTIQFALRGSNIIYKCKVPANIWKTEVDIGQISQVLTNLIINASQAMPDGGVITLECENVTISSMGPLPLKPGKYIKVMVVDQGVGIPSDIIPKIFDPYFTTKKNGNGLGLTVCYSIISHHHGYIGVESQPDYGATFYFYLPAIEEENRPTAPLNRYNPERQVAQGKILIMDDEKSIIIPLSQILQEIGYEVDLSTDGAEAIFKYIKAQEDGKPYQVVILDLTVPGGMGGEETIQRLRVINPQIKAIVSSGYSNNPVMSDPEKFLFDGVVSKPYRIEELQKVLVEVMNP